MASLLGIDTTYTHVLSHRDPTHHIWSKTLPTVYALFIAANFQFQQINLNCFLLSLVCFYRELVKTCMCPIFSSTLLINIKHIWFDTVHCEKKNPAPSGRYEERILYELK